MHALELNYKTHLRTDERLGIAGIRRPDWKTLDFSRNLRRWQSRSGCRLAGDALEPLGAFGTKASHKTRYMRADYMCRIGGFINGTCRWL